MTGVDRLAVVARFEFGGGIELEGTAATLLRLAAMLRRVDDGTVCQLTVPADREARPYDGFLVQLRLEAATGRVRIYRDAKTLRIEGSPEGLETLAQNVEFLVSSATGPEAIQEKHRHVHAEYYEEHPFLSQDAEPLTIVLA